MKKIKLPSLNSTIFILLSVFVFVFFYFISYSSPLAGDDWGYAVNGLAQNPFITAFQFYQSWSGRFFSELYGFLVTPNKELWNILNASLFTGIFILLYKLSDSKKYIFSGLVILFLMLSVKDELRMETYTWLMGTTYVIPLFLSLLFFYLNFETILNKTELSKIKLVLSCIILFYIGLAMENIAILMIVSNALFIVYVYIKNRVIDEKLILYLIISILSFTLLRLSPGANARLLRDHADWVNMSFIEQIIKNYSSFIRYTFIEPRVIILFLSVSLGLTIITKVIKSRRLTWFDIPLLTVLGVAAISSISLQLYSRLNLPILETMIDPSSIFNLIFWVIFIIAVFIIIWIYFDGIIRDTLYFLVLLAGIGTGVMMLSPIFGYRSSLYTIYFLILFIAIVINQFKINLKFQIVLLLVFGLLITNESRGLFYKYQLVQRVHAYRMSEIEYYRDNPTALEAWIIRYPIFTIHSGDVEEWDTYHMDVFKRYFDLNPDLKLYFYSPDISYEEFLNLKGW